MQNLTPDHLFHVLGRCELNLIRRGADGSLTMSADKWRLSEVGPDSVVFLALTVPEDAPASAPRVLTVSYEDVERITWDRLPRQQSRSQLRFHLTSGDLWTFSGPLAEPDS